MFRQQFLYENAVYGKGLRNNLKNYVFLWVIDIFNILISEFSKNREETIFWVLLNCRLQTAEPPELAEPILFCKKR